MITRKGTEQGVNSSPEKIHKLVDNSVIATQNQKIVGHMDHYFTQIGAGNRGNQNSLASAAQ